MSQASDKSICPCDAFEHPQGVANPPGQPQLRRRVGTFTRFRKALLDSIAGEQALQPWSARDRQDLGVMLLEMWAYLGDILTFYDERIANESYLRTAQRPESVQRLVRLLSYRPRPGIGAVVQLAATAEAGQTLIVPADLQIQSRPAPGQQPQVFEVTDDTPIDAARNAWMVVPERAETLPGSADSLLLQGNITRLRRDARALVLDSTAPIEVYAYVDVKGVHEDIDVLGQRNTRVALKAPLGWNSDPSVDDLRVFVTQQTAKLWPYGEDHPTPIGSRVIPLDGLHPTIQAGDLVLLVEAGSAGERARLFKVMQYAAKMGLVQAGTDNNPAIHIPYAELTLDKDVNEQFSGENTPSASAIVVLYGWQEVAPIISAPETVLAETATGVTVSLFDPPPELPPAAEFFAVLLEDAHHQGQATSVSAGEGTQPNTAHLSGLARRQARFAHPVSVYANLLNATRGQTVSDEVLGSGDASQANQEFVLQKSPLTYLLVPAADNPEGYQSTLHLWVNGLRWRQVPSFFGRGPDEPVYTTYEDQENKTHVVFGDGIHGARLPTGTNNVVAKYRVGSGQTAPAAGTLTTLLTPYPGLMSVTNPLPPGGGDDPEPPARIRRLAPSSVLTFGRAISLQDYEVIASQAPGVIRAKAQWAWDSNRQGAVVRVLVIAEATQHAQTVVAGVGRLLHGKGDPNRIPLVEPATPHPISLIVTLGLDDRFVPEEVRKQAELALLAPEEGLLSPQRVEIGKPLFHSEIMETLLNVAGVVHVSRIQLRRQRALVDLPQLASVIRAVDLPQPALFLGETEYIALQTLTIR